MLEGIAHAVVDLVQQYGYLVIFLFMFLETSMVFPLLPSEIVVPSTALLLVHDPLSFTVFILVATAGATVGSLFAYYVFGGGSHIILERYGKFVRVSDTEIDRAQHWYRHWGESSVFWGRLLPILRSIISIPAGFSEMPVWKFAAYSASGSLIFTAGVAALAWKIDVSEGPVRFLITQILELLLAYPVITLAFVVAISVLVLITWRKYRTQLKSYALTDA